MKRILIISITLTISLSIFSQKKDTENRSKYYDILQSLDIYNAIWRELDINYVDSLDHERLNKIAIDRMLQELDPYTIYIPAKEEEDLKAMTSGIYGGIGAIIQKHNDYVVVAEPRLGQPAQKNGILTGDKIIAINNESMKGKSNSYVSNKLRGIPGTEITLTLKRYGTKKNITKKFLREAIHINSIDYYEILQDSIGYISLQDFTGQSYTDCKAIVSSFKASGIKQLIIDLRNNGGGLVSEAVNIASMFVPKGTEIVYTKGKNSNNIRHYKTPFAPIMLNIPLAIIINNNSASASEIIAGAFQDLDRAIIIGQRSFGKGVVQNIRELPYGGFAKITTAKYYLPSGRCIQSSDYENMLNGNRTKTIPDSLTNAFKTLKGREVRDKSAITPDFDIEDEKGNYISYYLYSDNIIFDFATKYFFKKDSIASPDIFKLTDQEYQEFIEFVKESNFSYQLESEKILTQLKKMVALEECQEQTDSLLQQLSPLLKPNIERDLKKFRIDIQLLLEGEIVQRYFYHQGYAQFMLRYDKWVEKAVEVLKQNIKTKKV
ncbi:MAG: peptidase S41 [Bacteroidales bacterium]|nr:MAG: peptidase S41 [Bacteroidales bacterium]